MVLLVGSLGKDSTGIVILNQELRQRMRDKKNRIIRQIIKRRSDGAKGSITVEAAFVMPLVIMTIFALIYLTFYLHDVCRIQAILHKTLHKTGLVLKHDADIASGKVIYENINNRGILYLVLGDTEEAKADLEALLYQELSKGLLAMKLTEVKTEVGKFNLGASVKAEMKIKPFGLKSILNRYTAIYMTDKYPIHDPAESIRRTEVILDTGTSIKGVDELIKFFEKFIK